jgi:hypothetical protein
MLFVVRHSERLDDVDPDGWESLLNSVYSNANKPSRSAGRKRVYFAQDPPLSEINGKTYAVDVAETLFALINTQPHCEIRLHSSKLRRSVLTSIPIAKKLGVPIHLSAGLATVIPGVRRSGGKFEFQSLHEWQSDYPDILFVDHDLIDEEFPTDNWLHSISNLVQVQNVINIVVAHRETVRGLAGATIPTPYCCIAAFEPTNSPKPAPVIRVPHKKKQREGPIYRLLYIVDRFGKPTTS